MFWHFAHNEEQQMTTPKKMTWENDKLVYALLSMSINGNGGIWKKICMKNSGFCDLSLFKLLYTQQNIERGLYLPSIYNLSTQWS